MTIAPLSGMPLLDSKYSNLYNNPNFDYLAEMLPKNIKDMFKWAELVVNNAPVISNGMKKLINYPLTDFVYKTTSEKIREKTKDLIEKKLKMRSHLVDLGADYYSYGNVFRTVYFPFDRFLKCAKCGRETNINYAEFKLVRNKVVKSCECGSRREATIIDKESQDLSRVRLVNWDPHQMDLSYNPVTSETTYYYSLPAIIKRGLVNSDPTIVNTLPKIFMEAYAKGQTVKFGANMFHFKTPGLSGYASGWGIPPLMSALKPYLYIAILRKASEAIGLEHITPKNILFPAGTTNDPSVFSNMSRWRSEIEFAIKKWRQDPNHVMLAPYATGSVNIGSQGRALMPTREIQEANNEMALSLDVPPSFIYGTGTVENNTVTLRILENQLTPYVEQMVSYVNWVVGKINAKYGTDYCEVDLTPFTLVDDIMKRQMLLQTSSTGASSNRTLLEALDIDPDAEQERKRDERIADYKLQKEVERSIAEEEQNIASQTLADEAADAMGTVPQYNQQKLIAHAQELAQQLIMQPYEERRSLLSQLKGEDFVMYSITSKVLETMQDQKTSEPLM